jgi:hypothetical protein
MEALLAFAGSMLIPLALTNLVSANVEAIKKMSQLIQVRAPRSKKVSSVHFKGGKAFVKLTAHPEPANHLKINLFLAKDQLAFSSSFQMDFEAIHRLIFQHICARHLHHL